MTLIIEDGNGLTNSEAYISRTNADTYFKDRGNPSSWVTLSGIDKDVALRIGAEYLDLTYSQRWKGRRVAEDQALDWPRFGVIDRDGFAIDSDIVPVAVERANAEAALRHSTETDGLTPDIAEPGSVLLEKNKVGPLETTTQWSGKSQVKKFRQIDLILRDLILKTNVLIRA